MSSLYYRSSVLDLYSDLHPNSIESCALLSLKNVPLSSCRHFPSSCKDSLLPCIDSPSLVCSVSELSDDESPASDGSSLPHKKCVGSLSDLCPSSAWRLHPSLLKNASSTSCSDFPSSCNSSLNLCR